MKLNLKKPIVFFDLETTGINISHDRIVEISMLKISPNGNKESKTWLVNPEMEIPKESSDIHGITNKKIAEEPTFKELAPKGIEMMAGCDLAGFNSNRFDIPLLAEEMLRTGFEFCMKNRLAVDVQTIFHKKEQRTLTAGYKFYCDKDLTDAHSAEADTMATYEIFLAQLEKYEDLGTDIKTISEFSYHKKRADFAGFILFNEEEEEIFSFGKYKGQRVVDVLKTNKGYFSWMYNADFPLYTKQILKQIKDRMSGSNYTLEDLQKKFNG